MDLELSSYWATHETRVGKQALMVFGPIPVVHYVRVERHLSDFCASC